VGDAIKPRTEVVAESRRRGFAAGGSAAATTAVTLAVGLTPLSIAGIGVSGWLAWRWLEHRAKNGIRF
jgi:hypothetical protein